ncbi:MAG: MazG family protein, partial [Actinobacteria bacterium]|nr:MazG family protein [Actinomycetota bacterium]
MHRLRSGCPWDAGQTHASLVRYLVEETLEVVEAIEAGDDDHLAEELGDLLLQVVFHAEIAAETGRFDIEDVARRIADKLVARHPYVFSDAEVPEDLVGSWERAKAAEKARSSALEGIPERLSALTRAHKVIVRARS